MRESSFKWLLAFTLAYGVFAFVMLAAQPKAGALQTADAGGNFEVPATSAGSPYGLPRQSRLASYFPVGKLGSLDSHSSVFLPPSGAAPPPFSFGWPFLAPLGPFGLSHTNEPTQ